jgi:glucans biosynthesis protein
MHAPIPHEGPPDRGDRPLCGARTRAGAPCRKLPAPGRTRCRLHGGASPLGPVHPRFKHGRYSRLLPKTCAATTTGRCKTRT